MNTKKTLFVALISFFSFYVSISSQSSLLDEKASSSVFESFFEKADTLNKLRFRTSATFASVTYSSFATGLYFIWYKKYDQESFHLFNDFGEWRHIDKMGHFYTTYFQGVLCYKGARWTGLKKEKSILTGIVLGSLFQTTLEVMDGFSTKWGFSVPDMAFNIGGISTFAVQQYVWDEQRITLKVSNIPKVYDKRMILAKDGIHTSSLDKRAQNLFGTSFPEQFLKDYNSQVLWASFNIHSFLPDDTKFPNWLNIAVGYGAGNMFGGYQNTWEENGAVYVLDDQLYPRYSSFYLAPDIDLSRIRTKYKGFNSMLDIFDIFKLPMPAVEYNTLGEWHLRLLL